MYGGHVGAALGAWSPRRAVPLWLLVVAAQIPDWMDAAVCAVDGDRGPLGLYTHGLAAVSLAALVLAAAYVLWKHDVVGGVIVAALALSHLPLDYITGLKPTWANGPAIGLSLYDHPALDFAVEAIVIVIGWWLYRRSLPGPARRDGAARAMLVMLLGLQLVASIALALHLGGHVKCS